MTLYDDLGVPSDATTDEINAAYRRAAKQHHPDAGGDADTFARVSRAIAVLRDPERRAKYDATGDTGEQQDHTLQRVSEFLCAAFSRALSQCDPVRQDLVDVTKNVLRDQLNQVMAQRNGAVVGREKLVRARGRLGHEGDRPNLIAGMIDDQIKQRQGVIAEAQQIEAVIQQAIEFADDYSWTTVSTW